jgi:hypothetical protein
VWLLVAVVLAAIAIVVIKLALRPPETSLPVSSQIEQALASGEPAVFVFTYGGDCCASTRQAFDNYDQQVSIALGAYGSRVKVVWLDTSLEDNERVRAMADLANRFGVEYVPSLLLVSAAGERLWVNAGLVVTSEEVRAGLAAALGG